MISVMTALDSPVSNVSVNTAMSVVTVETNLHADADPPLERRMSFSTATEMSSEKTFDDESERRRAKREENSHFR